MKEKIISAVYISYGLIDIAISTLSSVIPIHMLVLAALCLAAGICLWLNKVWSIHLTAFAGFFTLIVGLTTFYSYTRLVGFSSSSQVLLFNISLIGYIVVMLGISIYTVANRGKLET